MKLTLFRRARGTFRLNTMLESQCDKIGRTGFASRKCDWHENLLIRQAPQLPAGCSDNVDLDQTSVLSFR